MGDYIYLQGSEDVQRAGRSMSESASTISQAVGNLESVLFNHRLLMDGMLARFEAAVDRLIAAQKGEIERG